MELNHKGTKSRKKPREKPCNSLCLGAFVV
jgi:hypothetical protein